MSQFDAGFPAPQRSEAPGGSDRSHHPAVGLGVAVFSVAVLWYTSSDRKSDAPPQAAPPLYRRAEDAPRLERAPTQKVLEDPSRLESR